MTAAAPSSPAPALAALVLAGQREDRHDPLADAHGLALKCMVPVAGRPMVLHVVEALAATPEVGRILISVNDTRALETLPEIRRLQAEGRLGILPAQHNLVDSVTAAARVTTFPLLITTADNVLLAPASVSEIQAEALGRGADIAVAFARRESVLAAHPDGQRRFYNFRCGAYSNCNAYWIGSRKALSPAEVFRKGGQFAKHPARIVQAFGLMNLIRFRFGIGTLADAFRRFSRRFRLTIIPVILTDGATAIDVDNARTLAVAEEILAGRRDT